MADQWLSWLDYVPVVGTVKNTVECVIALIGDDKVLAEQKAIEAGAGLVLDLTTNGFGYEIGEIVVKGVTKELFAATHGQVVKEAARQGGIVGTNVGLSHIINSNTGRIERPVPGSDQTPPSPEEHTRGEHVINNNVLKVFKNIIDEFISQQFRTTMSSLIDSGQLSRESVVYKAYAQSLPPIETEAIQSKMVAHFINEPYIDANSTLYGHHVLYLKTNAVSYMREYYAVYRRGTTENNTLSEFNGRLVRLIFEINIKELYVDRMALEKWLPKSGNEPARGNAVTLFEDCKTKVAQMFVRLRDGEHGMNVWVCEIRDAIERGQ